MLTESLSLQRFLIWSMCTILSIWKLILSTIYWMEWWAYFCIYLYMGKLWIFYTLAQGGTDSRLCYYSVVGSTVQLVGTVAIYIKYPIAAVPRLGTIYTYRVPIAAVPLVGTPTGSSSRWRSPATPRPTSATTANLTPSLLPSSGWEHRIIIFLKWKGNYSVLWIRNCLIFYPAPSSQKVL